jgi:beta-1,4-N-acetylglucosaminyltransferase
MRDQPFEDDDGLGGCENRVPMARRPSEVRSPVDVLLVCSTGGHLLQLHALRPAWAGTSHAWVTFDKSDARSLLAAEQVFFAFGPTNRNVGNLLRNLKLAFRLIRLLQPRVLVTTGAGVAVPFCWMARMSGAKIVYVESLSRIDAPSLSCRLIAPVAARIYAQWPELCEAYTRARYVGSVFSRG